MAENKKSFLLYCDLIHVFEKLTNEQAGVLIKHILRYVNDENPAPPDLITELVFEPIKLQLKRDLAKYKETKEKFSEAGKASAEARKIKKYQLYVIECYSEVERFIKVGITMDSISRRFSTSDGGNNGMPYKFLIIGQHFYSENEINPLDLEAMVCQTFKKYFPKIPFGGQYECLDISEKENIVKFIQQRSTTFNNVQQRSENPTVTVNDTVTDNVKDTVNVKESVKEKKEDKKNISEPSSVSIHSVLKKMFCSYYLDKTTSEYYWEAKDGSALKKVIDKLLFKIKEKNPALKKESEEAEIINGFRHFLNGIKDKWILENLSMTILNSKFNEIINQIINPHGKSISNNNKQVLHDYLKTEFDSGHNK